jgi:DNA-binding NtrC family response regulator
VQIPASDTVQPDRIVIDHPPEPPPSEFRGTRFHELYGASPAMQSLYWQIGKVAGCETTVLILGESGTGKELCARTIHALSARREGPFVAVNCGAIVPALIEAELFGHEKGSFTGALDRSAGYFEHAQGGTVFLDEISEMPLAMQVKLLRVLENGSFFRVGGHERVTVDVRIIAAANRSLVAAVKAGTFREDLMYRLAVFPLQVPPLRERRGDIDVLARHFVDDLNQREGTHKQLSRRALDVLRSHRWPGNVRELRNVVHRAFILSDRSIELAGIEMPARSSRPTLAQGHLSLDVGTPLADAQREIIMATLAHFKGDKKRASSALGISLKTLYNRLEIYGGDAGAVAPAHARLRS